MPRGGGPSTRVWFPGPKRVRLESPRRGDGTRPTRPRTGGSGPAVRRGGGSSTRVVPGRASSALREVADLAREAALVVRRGVRVEDPVAGGLVELLVGHGRRAGPPSFFPARWPPGPSSRTCAWRTAAPCWRRALDRLAQVLRGGAGVRHGWSQVFWRRSGEAEDLALPGGGRQGRARPENPPGGGRSRLPRPALRGWEGFQPVGHVAEVDVHLVDPLEDLPGPLLLAGPLEQRAVGVVEVLGLRAARGRGSPGGPPPASSGRARCSFFRSKHWARSIRLSVLRWGSLTVCWNSPGGGVQLAQRQEGPAQAEALGEVQGVLAHAAGVLRALGFQERPARLFRPARRPPVLRPGRLAASFASLAARWVPRSFMSPTRIERS